MATPRLGRGLALPSSTGALQCLGVGGALGRVPFLSQQSVAAMRKDILPFASRSQPDSTHENLPTVRNYPDRGGDLLHPPEYHGRMDERFRG